MKRAIFWVILTFILWVFPLYGETQRNPIDVNLIIDGSGAFSNVRGAATAWVLDRLDQVLLQGDRITVWNAGTRANIIFTGRIDSDSDRQAVNKAIRELTVSGTTPDFSGALLEASQRQNADFCYTLLISSSPAALSATLDGPQANLLRFSRVEEFSGWRALVVGLNLDHRVRNAATAFINQ